MLTGQDVLRSVVFVGSFVRWCVRWFVGIRPAVVMAGGRRCGRAALHAPGGGGALPALLLVALEILYENCQQEDTNRSIHCRNVRAEVSACHTTTFNVRRRNPWSWA